MTVANSLTRLQRALEGHVVRSAFCSGAWTRWVPQTARRRCACCFSLWLGSIFVNLGRSRLYCRFPQSAWCREHGAYPKDQAAALLVLSKLVEGPSTRPRTNDRRRFEDLEAAQKWACAFMHWYNAEHRHSGITSVSPDARHRGADQAILAARHEVYRQARARYPQPWARHTRDWSAVGAVTVNPERESIVTQVSHTQTLAA